jgi:hypothetical protein
MNVTMMISSSDCRDLSPPFRQACATLGSRGSGVSQASANRLCSLYRCILVRRPASENSRWIVAQLRLRGVPSRIHPKQRDQGQENKNKRQERACIHIFSAVLAIPAAKNLILRNSGLGFQVSSDQDNSLCVTVSVQY